MNTLLIKAVASVVLVAALLFAWNWHIDHERNIGYQKAVAVLAEKNTSTAEIQSALVAALNEARKPVDINLKIEMPEQRSKRFVAERDGEGRMTLSEVSEDSTMQH